jgi:two-component system, OmpR family, KDP operon response regulator KdpE
MPTILLVEDDPHMAEGLAYNLGRNGYAVLTAKDGRAGLQAALAKRPDLVILDLMLPLLDGFHVLERLRAAGSRVPVIVLSAKADETDKIRGFDAGADDYMSKPFGVGELLARIRARLGGTTGAAGAGARCFALAGGTADLDAHAFQRDGERTPLTPTEVRILELLQSHAGRPVTREVLLREVWGLDRATSRTLDAHLTRLRRKLERDPGEPRHLLTVHGVGYRLVP